MSISVDEFAKLQSMAMELKSEKYAATERADRLQKELDSLQASVAEKDKELAKATKALSKSKKAKEMQQLLEQHQHEVSSLEQRNKALLENLAQLSSENERLSKLVGSGPGGAAPASSSASATSTNASTGTASTSKGVADDGRSLEEITAAEARLKRQLEELKARLEASERDRETAEAKYLEILQGPSTTSASNAEQQDSEQNELGEGEEPDSEDGDLGSAAHGDITSLASDNEPQAADHQAAADEELNRLRQANSELIALVNKHKADVEAERQQLAFLREQTEQDAIVHQQEKADAQSALKQKEMELASAKQQHQQSDDKVKQKQAVIADLQKQLDELLEQDTKMRAEYEDKLKRLTEEHHTTVKGLQAKIDAAAAQSSSVEVESTQKVEALKTKLSELTESLHTKDETIADKSAQIQKLEEELEEASKMAVNNEQLQQQLQQAEQLAESRRALADDLAKEREELVSKHNAELETEKAALQEKIKAANDQHAQREAELQSTIKKMEIAAQKSSSELDRLREEAAKTSELSDTVAALQKEAAQLREQLVQAEAVEADLRAAGVHCLVLFYYRFSKLHQESKSIQHELQTKASDLETQVSEMKAQLEETSSTAALTKKKEASLMRDLQRQLQKEQKKAKKLEDELRAATGSPMSSQSRSHMSSPRMPARAGHRRTPSSSSGRSSMFGRDVDSASITQMADASSMSAMSDGLAGWSASDLPAASPSSSSSTDALIQRVTQLQASKALQDDELASVKARLEKLQLEKKARDKMLDELTTTGSTTATTVQPQSPVKPTKAALKALTDQNAKMRTLLEETLMKNIQLQEMVEVLSKQEQRGRAEASDPPAPNETT